jgi:hypothetical protein
LPFDVNQEHTDRAEQDAQHPKELHVSDQSNAPSQIPDLRQISRIVGGTVAVMQIPRHGGQRQETIGVSQQQQG